LQRIDEQDRQIEMGFPNGSTTSRARMGDGVLQAGDAPEVAIPVNELAYALAGVNSGLIVLYSFQPSP
jgi:hypothetical protein